MTLIVKDRVKESSTTTGTADFTLGGAASGFQTFAVIGNTNTTYYAAVDQANGTWEVGIGTYSSTGPTLTRDTVLESSNAGSKVSFAAGPKEVFCTYPAERSVYLGAAGSAVSVLDIGTLGVSTANITTANITAGTVTTSPASGNDLVNKTYVDTLVASGIHFHEPVRVESPINLNATYNNGTAGVGATLTNAGTQVALVIDGITMVVADRVLVYEQTNQTQNGVYVVTSIGSGSTNWVLTRSDDADTYGFAGPDTLSEGSTFFVKEGVTGAGETYTCNTTGTITFGTTNITFAQVSATQIYSAGTGLTLTGTQFSITNTGTAGTYGSASQVPVFTTNAQGQVTAATPTAIAIAAAAVSGLAASATTDTTNAANITSGTLPVARLNGSYTGITGVGTLAAGVWNASTIGATFGGTGLTSFVQGDLLYATSSTTVGRLADEVAGNALLSGGVGGDPAWGKIGLGTHVSGTLPVGNGGTGATTLSGYVFGNGTGAFTASASIPNSATTATSANTANAIVARDASGNFSAGTITAALNGNATTATTAANVNNGTLTLAVSGTGLSGSATFTANQSGNSTFTVTSNATNANTGSTLVARDASGNFSAGTITAALSGNATTATTATTAGNVTGTVAIANGGTGATSAAAARTNLGATTLGGNLYTLANVAAIAFPRFNADNTVSTLDATAFRTAIGAGTSSTTGTVTSVATAGTVSGLTLTGGPITTTGTITLGGTLAVAPSNFASQTANTVLAAPNGSAGVPTFRALVAADVPTLNQNTTGTAANVTGTVAIANGGTGATTAATARTNFGATTVGSNLFTLTNPAAITFLRVNADNTVSALDAATFRTAIGAGTSSTTGTVTSVAVSGGTTGLTTSGGPITTSGTVTLAGTLAVANGGTGGTTAQAARNNLAAAVTNGQYLRGNGTNVLMSAIQAADVPTLNQSTTGNAATATTLQTARTIGGVSFNGSANINLPGVNTAGNQNTTGTAANVTGTVAIANGGTGSTTAAAARTALGATTLGSNLFTITNPSAITFPRFNADNTVSSLNAADFRTAIGAGTASGTVTSVGGTGTVSGLSLSGTVTTSGNLTLGGTLAVLPSNFASQTAKTVLAAPNAAAGVPTFRLLVASDIPTLNQNTTGTAAISTAATVTTSATASAFKVPFANTTASTTGNYGLLQDSEATFTYNPSTNTLVVGTVSGALSGNATTATTLQTARTIGGVSFNGSANINLPGVNTAGNQNTTGSAATLTTGRTIALTGDVTYTSGSFNGSANVTGAATLATVNSNVGSFGSASAVPVLTVNAKGLITAVSTAAISAGGGQYLGTATVKAISFNAQTIGENITVAADQNCLSAGPITINSGFTVTITSGGNWVVI
jgi:hypothetical protein